MRLRRCRIQKALIVLLSLFLLTTAFSVVSANPASFQLIDRRATFDGGSMVLDSNNNPHISYGAYLTYNHRYGDVYSMYASWNGSGWDIQTIDPQEADGGSIALDTHGNPHVAYSNASELKYASWDGAKWDIQTIDRINIGSYGTILKVGSRSLAIDSQDQPHICYYGAGEIKYAKLTNAIWEVQKIGVIAISRPEVSLTLDPKGNPQVIYTSPNDKLETFNVNYAVLTDSGWKTQTIATNCKTLDSISCIVLDSKGNPNIAYVSEKYKSTGSTGQILEMNITYLSGTGSYWQNQTVDSSMSLYSAKPELALDSNDVPYICYYKVSQSHEIGGLMYATWNGSSWGYEILERDYTPIDVGTFLLDSKGNLQISCSFSTGYIYHPAGNLTYVTVSPVSTEPVEPLKLDLLIGIIVFAAVIGVIAVFAYKRKARLERIG